MAIVYQPAAPGTRLTLEVSSGIGDLLCLWSLIVRNKGQGGIIPHLTPAIKRGDQTSSDGKTPFSSSWLLLQDGVELGELRILCAILSLNLT